MPALVFFILVAAIALGVLLLVVGRRGVRINRHPVCAWCGFDVSGIYPAQGMCPECGGGLKKAGFVKIGVRRRLPVVAGVGALLILLPLVPLGLALYATLTGANLNTYKPLWMLTWEARHAQPGASRDLAKELSDRFTTKTLDESQEREVVAAILDLQGDRDGAAWDPAWGELFELARARDRVTPAQRKRYLAQAFTLKTEVRAQVPAGGVLPLQVSAADLRSGNNSWLWSEVYVTHAALNGRDLEFVPSMPFAWREATRLAKPKPLKRPFSLGGVYASAQAARGYPRYTCGGAFRVPEDLPPGDYEVEVRVVGRPADDTGTRFSVRPWSGPSAEDENDPNFVRASARLPVRVLPPGSGSTLLTRTPTSEGLDTKLRIALTPAQIYIQEPSPASNTQYVLERMGRAFSGSKREKSRWLSIQFNTDEYPTPIAFDISLRDATGRVIPCGPVASEPLRGVESDSPGGTQYISRSFTSDLEPPVTLVFTPNPALPLHTLEQTAYYDQTFEIADIPINEWNQRTGQMTPLKPKAKAKPSEAKEEDHSAVKAAPDEPSTDAPSTDAPPK